MCCRLIASLLTLAAVAFPAAGQEFKGAQCSVLAISVVKEPASRVYRAFNVGTVVSVAVHLPGKAIVGINLEACELNSFTDDKGTDLLNKDKIKRRLRDGVEEVEFRITTDCKQCRIAFRAPNPPKAGVDSIRIKAKLALLIGKDEKNFEAKDVAISKGVDLPRGKLYMTRTPTLEYRGLRPLKSLVLFDGENKEIRYKNGGYYVGWENLSLISALLVSYPYSGRLFLTKEVERCSIRAVYFEGVEKVTVPLDIETSVGPK